MRKIRVIEATPSSSVVPIRVAAYCRVSTEREEQKSSLQTQAAHFTRIINETLGWELVGIYAEQSSALDIESRNEFNRLLADCDARLIDIVLMKSISRFSGNTVDVLQILNKLVEKGGEAKVFRLLFVLTWGYS